MGIWDTRCVWGISESEAVIKATEYLFRNCLEKTAGVSLRIDEYLSYCGEVSELLKNQTASQNVSTQDEDGKDADSYVSTIGSSDAAMPSENYNDTTIANFRKYDNIEDSIEDHGRFLYENSRYAESGLFSGKNYKEQAQALENAGYSTVRNADGVAVYADKLIALIEKYNLMEYDNKVK